MIHVRVTDKLKMQLEEAAKASGRSMNAEIVQRLEASFEPRSISDIVDAHFSPIRDIGYAEAMVEHAASMLKHAQQTADECDMDPDCDEVDRVFTRYELKRASKDFERAIAWLKQLKES